MHPTGSFIYTVLERVRAYLDDTDLDAKYTNDFIVRNMICPAMVDVLSRLNMNREDLIVNRHTITLESGQPFYKLPPCIQEVWRVGVYSEGKLVSEVMPRGHFSPRGVGWRLEGSTLYLEGQPLSSTEIDIEYIHNGDTLPHYATDGVPTAVDTVRLSSAPTIGVVDRRENAYAGQILRIIPAAGPVVEEVIKSSSFKGNHWVVQTRLPIWEEALPTTTPYEIAPAGSQPLYDSISIGAAMRLGLMRSIPSTKMDGLEKQYRISMKTVSDNLANLNVRRGKAFDRDTDDNESLRRY
jgi:hypothetical protein